MGVDGRAFVSDRTVVLSLSCLLLVLIWSGVPGQHLPALLSCRELYSQFLREMIIQPGIAKANMGVSREDVTFEDHVSRGQQREVRLQSREGCGFGVGKVLLPQRIDVAFSPPWPFQYLFHSFG